jgi:hypothetical protein
VAPVSTITLQIVPRSVTVSPPAPSPERLQVAVVVHVARVEPEDVVIDVQHRERDGDPLGLDLLELQRRHRPRRVLDQDLVDGQVDLLPGHEAPARQVRGQEPVREGARLRHREGD